MKAIIVKIGRINEQGEPVGWGFDCSNGASGFSFNEGGGISTYGGYTIDELREIARPVDFSVHQLATIREGLLHVLDEGRLLPDGTRAPWGFYPEKVSGPLNIEPDWHMDESGDVNEQRLRFLDEVQTYLVKEAQKANVEIIDVKATAF